MTMLRSIREKKGLTVSQLAARASIPTRVLTDYEEGRLTMPLNHARLIAKALWVPIEDLMPPAGSVPPPPAPRVPQEPVPARPTQFEPGSIAQAGGAVAPTTATPGQAAPAPYKPPYEMGGEQRMERPETHRPVRGPEGGRPAGGDRGGGAHGPRATPHPPGPISEGQLQELSRLAARLDIDQEQMEARIGKALATLTRPEAKEWIKKLRAIADELAPTQKVRFGMWPQGQEDREASYLREQREAGVPLTFKLFNGEQVEGVVTDYTPYTITITLNDNLNGTGDEMVLRKLALAYYRRASAGAAGAAGAAAPTASAANTQSTNEPVAPQNPKHDAGQSSAPQEPPAVSSGVPPAHDHARDDHHQPLDKGIDSNHVGEPDLPEQDNMDRDRGV